MAKKTKSPTQQQTDSLSHPDAQQQQESFCNNRFAQKQTYNIIASTFVLLLISYAFYFILRDTIKQRKDQKIVMSLSEIYNFSSTGQVIWPTADYYHQLSYSNQTLWHQFDNQTVSGQVTAIFTTSGRSQFLQQTLDTFFQFNTYPLKKIIVVHDGFLYKNLLKLTKKFTSVTWIITNFHVGQLAAIDVAYSFIETQFIFHSEDDWLFLRKGFVEYCLHIFKEDPKVSSIWLMKKYKAQDLPGFGKLIIADYKINPFYSGHNFNPSIHRMTDYEMLKNGYSGLTYFASFGHGSGNAEQIISMHYTMLGYHTVQSPLQFVRHLDLREAGGGNKYYTQIVQKSQIDKLLIQKYQSYKSWVLEQEANSQKKSEQDKSYLKQVERMAQIYK